VVDDGYQDDAVAKLGDHRPAGPLRGGKYSKFDAGTRVPMLARWPGRIKVDTHSPALVSQVDFYASLGTIAGAKPAAGAVPDSMEQSAALIGQDRKGRDWLVEHAGTLTLIEGNWKLIPPNKARRSRATRTPRRATTPSRSSTISRTISARRTISRRGIRTE
jgi:arylsulfatase A-like enzyme